MKKGNYHFNTTGIIYWLGYGLKSNRNKFGHSVCKFATSKYYILPKFNYFYFHNLTKKSVYNLDVDKKNVQGNK